MWSLKRDVNIAMDILLFMVSINFMHLGQLILPVMCLILFIDNKFKFNVNNFKIFAVLCLFGLSFFVFSEKNLYCVMGFTFPMAYYIGSNIQCGDEKNIKKAIFIIALGMISHVLLNFVYDLSLMGMDTFISLPHYDIWTRDSLLTTITAIEYTIPLSLIYYLTIYEDNKKIKYGFLLAIVLMMIYDFALGRRTPILMLFVSLFVSFILDNFILGKKKIVKSIIIIFIALIVLLALVICMSKYNLFGLGEFINSFVIIKKFIWEGLDAERFEIFIDAIKIAPNHLWGKQEISTMLGTLVHELWMDIFDYAGIIPYILMIIYSVYFLVQIYKLYKKNNYSKEIKVLVLTLVSCCIVHMFLEPMMSNATIFLNCVIIIGTVIEKGNLNVEKN